jgi:hypothetical protein
VVRCLAHRADHFFVIRMTDEYDGAVARGVPAYLVVNLGDEGAGGIDDAEVPVGGLRAYGGGDAVGREYDEAAFGDRVDLLDEDGTTAFEILYDVTIVDNLTTDVDRGAEAVEGALDGFDGALDAGTEGAGAG